MPDFNQPAKDFPAAPRRLSSMGHGVEFCKARDHLGERLVCKDFTFQETQFGESYNLLCATAETGEIVRFTGRHSRIMDRLKYVIKDAGNCPFQFVFINAGTAAKPVYDMGDWDND